MNFYGFWKNSKFHSKSIRVSLRFSENRQLGAKTDQNSVILDRDTQIADWLYVIVPYMSFDRF
jgi:hypothetical protein